MDFIKNFYTPPKNLNTYLGQKGYTIHKKELEQKDIEFIKKELTIKPYVMGAPQSSMETFPAYRESSGKFYIPRYFGEQHFGLPKQNKIPEGSNIDIKFNGDLRDYQKPVVQKYLDHVKSNNDIGAGGLLELYCAWGKTSASLYIISALAKKTLVIVHKEFLLNQWVERINQFLPTARIGRIQGQIIDIDDKDIVICMLQSLSMKDYPASLFDSFGLTIIDEVHHIASETFSNALFKLVTKYMLGLSATMNRKDGTTFVFKMFLGDVVHKAVREGDSSIALIKTIHYKVCDDDFNETLYDFRGNPNLAGMICKLCDYNNRTEFILKVLVDSLKVDNIDNEVFDEHKKNMDSKNPECKMCKKNKNYLVLNSCCNSIKYCLICIEKIINDYKNNPEITFDKKTGEKKTIKSRPKCPECFKILKYEQNYIENKYLKPISDNHTIIMSHNLNVLEYMYNKIVCKNLASVGYYVGGMKEKELKESEKKQVILSTYQMCSEALDIPSLTTEFYITPKTDIEQCVGRILRAKHKTATPTIYDFVDSHDVFKKQYLKRKTFYKKNNYKIIEIDNNKYTTDITKWKTTNDSKKCSKNINENNNIILEIDTDNNKNELLQGKCLINIKSLKK